MQNDRTTFLVTKRPSDFTLLTLSILTTWCSPYVDDYKEVLTLNTLVYYTPPLLISYNLKDAQSNPRHKPSLQQKPADARAHRLCTVLKLSNTTSKTLLTSSQPASPTKTPEFPPIILSRKHSLVGSQAQRRIQKPVPSFPPCSLYLFSHLCRPFLVCLPFSSFPNFKKIPSIPHQIRTVLLARPKNPHKHTMPP